MRKTASRYRGIALLWVVVTFVMFVGFVGLAVDIGHGLTVGQQLQHAADAAALAGALEMKGGEDAARAAAVLLGGENKAAKSSILLDLNESNSPGGDVVIGIYDRFTGVFTPQIIAANSVKVVARRTDTSLNGSLALFFGPIFGVNTVNISRDAIAMNEGANGAGLIALCTDCPSAFEIIGTADLTLHFGAIQINSDSDRAVRVIGDGIVDAAAMNITGDYQVIGNATIPANTNTGVPALADPLAAVPEPTWDPLDDLGAITTAGTYPPGYYSGGIDLNGGDTTFLPGIYILDGVGLHVGGNANVTAVGVMFYIPPGTADVDVNGTGAIHISPPDTEVDTFDGAATYENISIFQSRTNSNPGTMIGTSDMDLDGTFYFPAAHMRIGGTGVDLGSQVVTHTVEVFGTGLNISWDGSFPGVGRLIYLVE